MTADHDVTLLIQYHYHGNHCCCLFWSPLATVQRIFRAGSWPLLSPYRLSEVFVFQNNIFGSHTWKHCSCLSRIQNADDRRVLLLHTAGAKKQCHTRAVSAQKDFGRLHSRLLVTRQPAQRTVGYSLRYVFLPIPISGLAGGISNLLIE